MLTETEQIALINHLAQSVGHDLGQWLNAQRDLGAVELPLDEATWGMPEKISLPDPVVSVKNEPVLAQDKKSGFVPKPVLTASQPTATVAANSSLASFMAMRQTQTQPKYESEQEQQIALNIQKAHAEACRLCPIGAKRRGIVWGIGPIDARLMFVAAGGNPKEWEKGRIFTDEAADLMDRIVSAISGMHPDATADRIYMTNVIKCACIPERTQTLESARSCLRFLHQEVQIIRPKVIVVWGELAYRAMFGNMQTISQVRGIWQSFDGIPAIPTHHPMEMIRNPKLKGRVWQDLQLAVEKLKV